MSLFVSIMISLWFILCLCFTDTSCLTTNMCVCVYRNPGESGREGASVVVDDKPALWSARAAARSSFWAEEHGRSAAGETAATDGTGKAAARTGVEAFLVEQVTGKTEEQCKKAVLFEIRKSYAWIWFLNTDFLFRSPNSSSSWYSSSIKSTYCSSKFRWGWMCWFKILQFILLLETGEHRKISKEQLT